MTIRIGVDATAWSNQRGDGRFVRNAVGRLISLHPEVDWELYADRDAAERINAESGATATVVRQGRPTADALRAGSARSPLDLARLTMAVRAQGLDAFLSPSVLSWFPVIGVPSVVGLHDATASTHARLVLPSRRDRILWRIKQGLALRRARRVFTVSHASRASISENLGIPAEEIEVVPEAPDPAFRPRPPAVVDASLAALGLADERHPIVFAAGMSPHKGLADLAEAYAAAAGPLPTLVIAGSLAGPYPSAAEEVWQRIAELGISERVRFPGFVSDEVLACLYSTAAAVVVPSQSEGFGLSALEAAACGAPVVASDIGPHRETLNGAALFFPPGDTAALGTRLTEVFSNSDLARTLREGAAGAAARFSWDETARRLYALLVEAARGPDEGGQSRMRSPEDAAR